MMERKNYKDILNKYDILQKEQIDAKSKMTAEKEKLQWYMNFNLLHNYYLFYFIVLFEHSINNYNYFLVY